MSLKVVILDSAKLDLTELRSYIVARFSQAAWLEISSHLRSVLKTLADSPQAVSVPPEIQMLNLDEYRQVMAGMNRIIYEVRHDMVFVHAIVDARRDMVSVLTKRLLRAN